MLHCAVTFSANAGLMIAWHGFRIWIDALHQEKTRRFSTLTSDMWADLQCNAALEPPDLICFTHCHPEHYSKELTAKAHTLWPKALLALPKKDFSDQILLAGPEHSCKLGNVKITFFPLPHEGSAYAAEPHYGVLLQDGEARILVAGDCAVATPLLAEQLGGKQLDLAILDFPWLTLRRGRDYVESILRPIHLLLCHLPFPPDDCEGYLKAAQIAAQKSALQDVRLLTEFLQRECI